MRHGSLFSGIGGFDLAARWCDWENVFQVEIDSKAQKVLEKNFPHVKRFSDIKTFNAYEYRNNIDVISGGFPCQPFSVAGKRKGSNDDRALWCEMFRVICEAKPNWVVAENVPGLLSIENGLVLEQCLLDLESENYQTQTFVIPACAVNAPHKRERVWIVAYANSNSNRGTPRSYGGSTKEKRLQERHQMEQFSKSDKVRVNSNTNRRGNRFTGYRKANKEKSFALSSTNWNEPWFEVATRICRVHDGLSGRVDRFKQLGNAIVPQIAYNIFRAIETTTMELEQ